MNSQSMQSYIAPLVCHLKCLHDPSLIPFLHLSFLRDSSRKNVISLSSFHFLKNSISIPSSNSLHPAPFDKIPMKKLTTTQYGTRIFAPFSTRLAAYDPNSVPGKSPPEFTPPPPVQEPTVIPEVPRVPGVPDFDPIPSENPADPPPLSPGPNPGPEFPGPPNPSPPIPDAPQPPLPSPPGKPEVPIPSPPGEPDVVPPPKPPEPNQPDIPPPIMGSDGLVFY